MRILITNKETFNGSISILFLRALHPQEALMDLHEHVLREIGNSFIMCENSGNNIIIAGGSSVLLNKPQSEGKTFCMSLGMFKESRCLVICIDGWWWPCVKHIDE